MVDAIERPATDLISDVKAPHTSVAFGDLVNRVRHLQCVVDVVFDVLLRMDPTRGVGSTVLSRRVAV